MVSKIHRNGKLHEVRAPFLETCTAFVRGQNSPGSARIGWSSIFVGELCSQVRPQRTKSVAGAIA